MPNGARIVINTLVEQGIRIIPGIPGGPILPLYHELAASPIRHILARHEQGAGFIAQGLARTTGRPAVCLASSGPGAANLFTAIMDARMDSVPVIAITANVSRHLMGTDAFQEMDVLSLTMTGAKHGYLVLDPRDLAATVNEAFHVATRGRPGPVWIDIPKDVLNAEVDDQQIRPWLPPILPASAPAAPDQLLQAADQVARRLLGARQPVLYCGGGARSARCAAELRRIARLTGSHSAVSLQGLGIFGRDVPGHLGMAGMHGSRECNQIMDGSDCLVGLGVRFDDRATGDPARFCPGAWKFHADIDPSEINKLVTVDGWWCGEAADFAQALRERLEQLLASGHPARAGQARDSQARTSPAAADHDGTARQVIAALARQTPPASRVCTDVGQHQMWVAQYWPFNRPGQLLSSGGAGTMGFGLPAAIGSALADPSAPVVCISGDGSILMNIQELATLAEAGLDIKIFILDNGHLGLVRQQQTLFYQERHQACAFAGRPDFAAIAAGFGIPGIDAARTGLEPALRQAFARPGPCLVRIPLPADELVLPMVPPGRANHEMLHDAPAASPDRRPELVGA